MFWIFFTVLTVCHQITKPHNGLFLHTYIFIFTGSPSAQTDVLVSKLTMLCGEEATTTQANPSNVPQRGLARGRDLDEREGEGLKAVIVPVGAD